MKRLLLMFVLLLSYGLTYAQDRSIHGAYLAKDGEVTHLWLFVDGYSSYIQYKDGVYQSTWGGPYSKENGDILVSVEYDDQNPSEIGQQKNTGATHSSSNIQMGNLNFQQQVAEKQDLDGLWRITGRKQGEELSEIPRGDRKTIKILVDGYFQWIAINPAEKGFYGTGGGHYTFNDGKYTENILFFSRDDNRVGASLNFEGKIQAGQWHHSGLSSKGDPIYEIWSRDQ
ncbi:MAG: hypothetical protein ACTHZ1_09870 [Sphingobacterium sp.]